MGNLKIEYGKLRFEFSITKDKKLSLLYVGPISRKKLKVSNKDIAPFYTFVEAHLSGGNIPEHHGIKYIQTEYAYEAKYVRHETIENDKGLELIIVTSNGVLEITSFIQIYKDVAAFSIYNQAKNISKSPISLEYLSSFNLVRLGRINSEDLSLYQANSSWYIEAQWIKDSFLHLGLYNGNDFLALTRYAINNIGSWSTKEHLPMVVVEDKRRKLDMLVQVESSSSWHIELGTTYNEIYLATSGPEFYDHGWKKILNPNDTFASVQTSVSFGSDFEESIQEITKVRRINRRFHQDNADLPVIFNDYMHALWDKQTTELILPLVDMASEIGCDEFCIDAGWFAEGTSWWNTLGRWKEEPKNFPNGGLKAVINYIKSKGMKAGIWIEIEAIGKDADIIKEMNDDWFFTINGKKTIEHNRYQLNFANEEVYQYALGVIDEIMSLYNIDYLKIDYNTDCGVGTDYHTDSVSDGLLNHARAYIKWLNEVMDKYPNLTIENCASGGCRMDSEILKVCPIQSTSDQANFRKYPYLSANVLTAVTPEQAAVWSYPVSDLEKTLPTDEEVAMNMVNSMLGRIHLASFLNKLTNKQLDLVKEGIAYYRSIIELKKRSVPVYPKGTAKFFDKEVVGGIKDDERMIIAIWNTSGKARKIKVNLAKYQPKEIKVAYPLSLETAYRYDKDKMVLELECGDPYMGRIFEIKL